MQGEWRRRRRWWWCWWLVWNVSIWSECMPRQMSPRALVKQHCHCLKMKVCCCIFSSSSSFDCHWTLWGLFPLCELCMGIHTQFEYYPTWDNKNEDANGTHSNQCECVDLTVAISMGTIILAIIIDTKCHQRHSEQWRSSPMVSIFKWTNWPDHSQYIAHQTTISMRIHSAWLFHAAFSSCRWRHRFDWRRYCLVRTIDSGALELINRLRLWQCQE